MHSRITVIVIITSAQSHPFNYNRNSIERIDIQLPISHNYHIIILIRFITAIKLISEADFWSAKDLYVYERRIGSVNGHRMDGRDGCSPRSTMSSRPPSPSLPTSPHSSSRPPSSFLLHLPEKRNEMRKKKQTKEKTDQRTPGHLPLWENLLCSFFSLFSCKLVSMVLITAAFVMP